jgi:hypothetical protein
LGRHARYRKYYYRQRIGILRVRCHGCGVTHALIPSFSLPGTSIGTKEAEAYLEGRHRGQSRAKAGRLLAGRAMGERYLKQLERMLARALARAKAIFRQAADERLEGRTWIDAVCGPTDRPIFELNQYALAHGVNAIFCCRAPILLFGRAVRPGGTSHEPGSAPGPGPPVDSG